MSSIPTLDGPRRAHADELDGILDLANEVMRLSRGWEPTIGTDYSFIYNQKNAENIMIVKDGERVVSTAAMWMNTVEAGSGRIRAGGFNCVATRPAYRGHGLATKVMTAAVEYMAEIGCQVGRLSTNISDWYHRMGWGDAGSRCNYRLNHSNIGLFPELPDELSVTEGTEFNDEIISEIVCLRQADQLGGRRTQEIMGALLAAGSDPELQGKKQYAIAWQDDTPVAYCIERKDQIIEWGGQADRVAGLVRKVFGRRIGERGGQLTPGHQERVAPSRELTLVAPYTGHRFAEFLKSISVPCDINYWGMLTIIDPRGILDGFGLDDITVTEMDGKFALARGDESATVSRQELAKLLFGPERISDFAGDVLPLLFWEWPLEHV